MQFAAWTTHRLRWSRRALAISCVAALVTAASAAHSAEPLDAPLAPAPKPLATAALTPPAGKIDTEHVAVVRAVLEDPDAGVRRAAGLALERMVGRLDLPEKELP